MRGAPGCVCCDVSNKGVGDCGAAVGARCDCFKRVESRVQVFRRIGWGAGKGGSFACIVRLSFLESNPGECLEKTPVYTRVS